jgi:hypothetical protein
MRSRNEKATFNPDEWIKNIRDELTSLVPINVETACHIVGVNIPWHVYSKRRWTTISAAKQAISILQRGGGIDIVDGVITNVRDRKETKSIEAWRELIDKMKKGGTGYGDNILNMKRCTVVAYFSAAVRLGWIKKTMRGNKMISFEWIGPDEPDITAILKEHRKARQRTKTGACKKTEE